MKPLLLVLACVALNGCGTQSNYRDDGSDRSLMLKEGRSPIKVAKADLGRMDIDPDSKEMTIQNRVDGAEYFRRRPTNDYWNIGRSKVDVQVVDIVIFTDQKLGLGGVHQYFFRAGTSELLWIARGG
tara:strand:+ start:474 stop:854 length:381 start_codon:yes stop_codon:yes gene_type:complete